MDGDCKEDYLNAFPILKVGFYKELNSNLKQVRVYKMCVYSTQCTYHHHHHHLGGIKESKVR